jgi:hypothetical protein
MVPGVKIGSDAMVMGDRWRVREEERRGEEWMRLGVRDPHEINAIAQLLDESSIKHAISYMNITIESNMLQPLLVPLGKHLSGDQLLRCASSLLL